MKASGSQDARTNDRQDAPSHVRIDGAHHPHPHLPLVGKFAPRPGHELHFPSSDHDLTVVVPAYNEESRLPATLDGLEDYLERWGIDYRVLVVDDGSRDRTAHLTAERSFRFATISQPNQGKGAAIRNGMLNATGRIVAFTDADLPYDLDGLKMAYEAVASRTCEVVFGARDLRESAVLAQRRLARTLATHVFRSIVRFLVSRSVTDTQCGLKLFSRQAALELFTRTTIDGFAFDAEVVFLTHRLELPFQRIPVTLINEYASTISLTRHAIPMLLDVLRVRRRDWQGEYALGDEAPAVVILSPAPTASRAAA